MKEAPNIEVYINIFTSVQKIIKEKSIYFELIINIFEDKNFFYVENLVWVQEHEEDAKNMQEV